MAITLDVTVELTKTVLDVRSFIMEGHQLINSLQYTGSKWTAHFPDLKIGKDDDVDLFLHVEGLPKSKCTVTVSVKGKKPVKYESLAFNNEGRLILTKTIKPGELKDA